MRFNTPIVSVELLRGYSEIKKNEFQYSNCIGRMKMEFILIGIYTSFNTPIVSVELKTTYLDNPFIEFQYSNCIGRI